MATTNLTSAASSISAKGLTSFEGMRASNAVKVSSFSPLKLNGESRWSFRGLVVKAATKVAPKYTSLKPLGDRVLVKIKAAEEKTSGGILLPTTALSKPQGGEVVAVGEGRTIGKNKVEISLKAGTQVVYSKYAGTEVEFDGSNHLILKEDDIVGTLDTEDIKDLKPLNDRVLIKVAEVEDKTAGGLFLTDASKEKPSIGSVVAVGPGRLDEDGDRKPLSVAPGNTVLYSKYAGSDFKGFSMESRDGVAEIDCLERGLLPREADTDIDDQDPVLYAASFDESEENFVNYQTAYWVLYSLLLVLVWGFGLFMLIYLPLRRYILRKDIRSRKLYVTPNAIVYKVRKPVAFPCFGFLEKEKYVLLPSVADVVIEQGYLQSLFGVYSVRIENIGVRRPASDDVKIQGVSNPLDFRKVVLSHLSNMRDEVFSRQASAIEEVSTPRIGHSSVALMSPPSKSPGFDYFSQLGDMTILQKLEEVSSSVKRVQALIEEQNPQAPAD